MARKLFTIMFKYRWLVLAAYVLLLIPSAYFAAQVETDNSLERMVVPGESGKKIFENFRRIFGSDEFMLIGLEGKNIYSERFLGEVDEVERQLQKVPHLAHTRSLISIYREVHPLFNPHEKEARDQFKIFATSTPFFNYQGLILPDRLLSVVLQVKSTDSAQRREMVSKVHEILEPFKSKKDSPFYAVRVVGQPNINYELDSSSNEIGRKFFPFYLLFAMGLVFFLYRSARGVLAVLITLGVSLAMSVASVTISGSMLTIISAVLPMMVMVVTIETIVHIYSGYARMREGLTRSEHLINVLVQKWKACWFSVFTTSVGFGSFAVSPVLPVRDLGIFVAISLVLSYIACFTLFPVLLVILKPPTNRIVKSVGLQVFDPILSAIPNFTYSWRKTAVPIMTILGAIAIHSFFGMEMETNTLNYLNHDNQLYKDTVFVEDNLMGLLSVEVMIEGKEGQFSSPDMMRKLQELEGKIKLSPDAQSLLSSSMLLRMANFIENGEDSFPRSNFAVSKYIMALSQREMWDSYVSEKFDRLRISVITKNVDYNTFDRLRSMLNRVWGDFIEKNPEFKDTNFVITGMAPLTANITKFLFNTLVSSFSMTFLVVFAIFLLEIRRLTFAVIAILPSIFAILWMYWFMTISGSKLDIGSIMIAAVVLGISVDATIHFFQHFMEKRKQGKSLEESLQYTMIISGRAILVSTLVIFAGFMTFSFSGFPPVKKFGVLTSAAVIFSLLGTLLYLPSCLWLMNPKEKPEKDTEANGGRFSELPPP